MQTIKDQVSESGKVVTDPTAGIPFSHERMAKPMYCYIKEGILFFPMWSGRKQKVRNKVTGKDEFWPDIHMVAVSDQIANGRAIEVAQAQGSRHLEECPRTGMNMAELDKHIQARDAVLRELLSTFKRKRQLLADGVITREKAEMQEAHIRSLTWYEQTNR